MRRFARFAVVIFMLTAPDYSAIFIRAVPDLSAIVATTFAADNLAAKTTAPTDISSFATAFQIQLQQFSGWRKLNIRKCMQAAHHIRYQT